MNRCSFSSRPVTTYCSRNCYKKEARKFIWNYQYRLVIREFKTFIKDLFKFFYLIYKWYLKDILNFILGFSILIVVYLIINGLIWAIETYIK